MVANLVPADDVDVYRWHVGDGWQLQCNGTAAITLTAPRGASQRVTVLDGDEVRTAGGVDRRHRRSASRLRESDCGGDDSADLLVRVESVGSDRSRRALPPRGRRLLLTAGHRPRRAPADR